MFDNMSIFRPFDPFVAKMYFCCVQRRNNNNRVSHVVVYLGVITIPMKMEQTPIWDTAKKFNSMPAGHWNILWTGGGTEVELLQQEWIINGRSTLLSSFWLTRTTTRTARVLTLVVPQYCPFPLGINPFRECMFVGGSGHHLNIQFKPIHWVGPCKSGHNALCLLRHGSGRQSL